jgi:hypothetical protein
MTMIYYFQYVQDNTANGHEMVLPTNNASYDFFYDFSEDFTLILKEEKGVIEELLINI